MDDFLPETLKNSISEYSQRLISILTPEIYIGFQAILNDSYQICIANNEKNKYLMTFQNCIKRIPKYNQTTIETECNRIIEKSGCNYLEDLLTVIHIILLKNLTTIRVGNRQKKIDISIPKLDMFIHKIYINVGRKLYQNVDLFIIDIPPMQKMKNRRIIENIIEKCILDTIRDNMPIEHIIRNYLDETEEHEEEELEQIDEEIPPPPPPLLNKEELPFNGPVITDMNKDEPFISKVSFNPIDTIHDDIDIDNNETPIITPNHNIEPRKLQEENDNERIHLLDEDDLDLDIEAFDLNNKKSLPNANNTPHSILRNKSSSGTNNFNLSELDEATFDAL